MKEILFKWNRDMTHIKTNQKVLVKMNPTLSVRIQQNTSTPGIIFNPIFRMKKGNYYIVYVQGHSNRENNTFIWLNNSSNKRMIRNYTFLSSNKDKNTKACFKAEKNDIFKIGLLVTTPKINDYFILEKLLLIEVDKDYVIKKSIECGPKKCDLDNKEYENIKDIDSSSDESFEGESHVSSIDYENLSLEDEDFEYNLITHLGIEIEYDYKKLFDGLNEVFISDDILNELIESYTVNDLEDYNYNSLLPTGFTFLSQFIIHDITNSTPNSFLERSYLKNNNSPYMDLDSLYGSKELKNYIYIDGKFIYNYEMHDLPRNLLGEAIIPDKRNDENYILSQLHLIWMMFHNKLFDYFKKANPDLSNDEIFTIARKEVTYHYQWIIINDYLPRLIDNKLLDDILEKGNKIYNIDKYNLFIPLEFTVAAMRYGHFTLKNQYQICDELYINTHELLDYTKGNLPKKLINWTKFFKIMENVPEPHPSKAITPYIQSSVNNMINKYPIKNDRPNSLYLLDLKRGVQVGLSSGQSIAKKIGLEPLSFEQLKSSDFKGILEKNNLLENTPLLLYILKESEIITNGTQLTGVGGRIVGEVIIGLIKSDENSYMNRDIVWNPYLPSLENDTFTMGDIIKYVYT